METITLAARYGDQPSDFDWYYYNSNGSDSYAGIVLLSIVLLVPFCFLVLAGYEKAKEKWKTSEIFRIYTQIVCTILFFVFAFFLHYMQETYG